MGREVHSFELKDQYTTSGIVWIAPGVRREVVSDESRLRDERRTGCLFSVS